MRSMLKFFHPFIFIFYHVFVSGGVTEVVGLYNPMAPGEDKWTWSKDNPVVWKGNPMFVYFVYLIIYYSS